MFIETKPPEPVELQAIIERASEQSGIRTYGDAGWLEDPRIKTSLLWLTAIMGEQGTKNAPEILLLTHVITVAHLNYNSPELRADGTSPILAAYAGLHHDTIEELRDRAKKFGEPFVYSEARAKIERIWNEPQTWPIIRRNNAYMTDRAHVTKEAHVNVQKKKSFDQNGYCMIPLFDRVTRYNDKKAQAAFDTRLCREGRLSDAQIIRAFEKAMERRWTERLPGIWAITQLPHLQNLDYLADRAAKVLGTLTALEMAEAHRPRRTIKTGATARRLPSGDHSVCVPA